jgi:hypothetical protein
VPPLPCCSTRGRPESSPNQFRTRTPGGVVVHVLESRTTCARWGRSLGLGHIAISLSSRRTEERRHLGQKQSWKPSRHYCTVLRPYFHGSLQHVLTALRRTGRHPESAAAIDRAATAFYFISPSILAPRGACSVFKTGQRTPIRPPGRHIIFWRTQRGSIASMALEVWRSAWRCSASGASSALLPWPFLAPPRVLAGPHLKPSLPASMPLGRCLVSYSSDGRPCD